LLGRISFPNSGSSPAQSPFIRGVLLLHSFEYDDAIEAFREAERLDPGFAMAYWGEAMCYKQPLWFNEDLAKARAALARLAPTPAARAAKAPTDREKGYLTSVERLYGEGSKASRDRAYADAMRALSRAYSNDDEAGAFLALSLLAMIPEGQRSPQLSLEAGAIATAILKRNPQHPGAAHYALHAYDDGEHAAMGLEAARTYARIAPASSHARHMPSHVFLPLGMWDEAAASDEAAFAASVDHSRRKGLSAAQQDFHSLGWLQYEYLQQGRFDRAGDLMKNIDRALAEETSQEASRASAGSHSPSAGHLSHLESEIGKGFDPVSLRSEHASMRARLIVESQRWDEMKGQSTFDNVNELFVLALASAKTGDQARAEAAFDQLEGARRAAPDEDNRRLAQIMIDEAAGAIQLSRGLKSEALAALAAATKLESQMPRPIARPYSVKPAVELYAETLLATGDAAAAVKQFQASLARTPRRAASLLGLARALQASGRAAEASKAAREFIDMWHLADATRPELTEARRLAGNVRP
jgi:tetratricopeptide (TPR) repeat protein